MRLPLGLLLSLTAAGWGTASDAQTPRDRPGPFHGNWRMIAADDRHDQGLMHVTIQLSAHEHVGSGDYDAHQPICSFLDGGPVRGDGECEIGPGLFDRVERNDKVLTLRFAPTADGQPHRVVLRRRGGHLVGRYVTDDIDRPVIWKRSPGTGMP